MLVDDDVDLLDSIEYLLKFAGYNITTAADGLEAVSTYREKNPCMVFMDVRMPNMDGFEAFNKIKIIDDSAKIILMSGFVNEPKKLMDAKNKGLLDFQDKPLSLTKFKKLIAKFD